MLDQLMTLQDLAAKFNCGQTKARELIAHPQFPKPAMIGRSKRWRPRDVERFIDRQVSPRKDYK